MNGFNRLSLASPGNSKSKKTVSSIFQDQERSGAGVIPVEISSCTNKAEWITKASKRGEEERRLQNHSIFTCTCSEIALASTESNQKSGNHDMTTLIKPAVGTHSVRLI